MEKATNFEIIIKPQKGWFDLNLKEPKDFLLIWLSF